MANGTNGTTTTQPPPPDSSGDWKWGMQKSTGTFGYARPRKDDPSTHDWVEHPEYQESGYSAKEQAAAAKSSLPKQVFYDPTETTPYKKVEQTVEQNPLFQKTFVQHPYLTAGALGAAFPPDIPEVVGATLGPALGSALGPAYGAVTGMATQARANLAARIAEATGHPDLATPAALLGGLSGEVTDPRVGKGLVSGPEMAKEVKEVEEPALGKGAKARARASKAASEEAAGQTAAEQQAAGEAGQAAYEARSKFTAQAAAEQAAQRAQVETAVPEAQQAVDAARRGEQEKIDDQTLKAEEAATKQYRELARQKAIEDAAAKPVYENTLGPGPERTARDDSYRNAIRDAVTDYRDDWGIRYARKLGPIRGDTANASLLAKDIKEEQEGVLNQNTGQVEGGWQKDNRPISGAVRNLYDRVKAQIEPTAQTPQRPQLMSQEEFSRTFQRAQAGDEAAARRLEEENRARQAAPATAAAPQAEPSATIRDLLKIQQEAKKLARTERDAPSAVAANVLVEGINKVLTNHVENLPPERAALVDLPGLKDLNREYFDHRLNLPFALERDMNAFRTGRPVDAAAQLFTRPQAALEVINHAQDFNHPETIAELNRQLVANVQEHGSGWLNRIDQKVLDGLVPQGNILRDKASWVRMDENVKATADAIKADPVLRAGWEQSKQALLGDIDRRLAQAQLDETYKQAKKFGGPLSKQLIARMRNAYAAGENYGLRQGPQMAIAEATRFFADAPQLLREQQISIEEQLRQSGLRDPLEAALGGAQRAAAEAPTTARQFEQNMPTLEKDVEGQVLRRMTKGYEPSAIWRRWKQRGAIWATVIPGTMILGRFSGYAIAGMAGVAALGLRELMYAGIRTMMEDPAKAAPVIKALQDQTSLFRELREQARGVMRGDPPVPPSNALLRAVARSIYAAGMAKMQADQDDRNEAERLMSIDPASSSPPPPGPVSSATGPGVKAAERLRAEAIAPSRGTADSAEKLAMNVSRPNPVDVSRDLTSGRHSVDEIKKTLQFANNPKASNVLAGMPIQDAVTALELASPEERQMLLPVLQMRMRQEMPQIKSRTMQANLAQRMKRLQTAQPVGETALA